MLEIVEQEQELAVADAPLQHFLNRARAGLAEAEGEGYDRQHGAASHSRG